MNEIRRCVNLYMEFWVQLLEEKPDLTKIKNLGAEIYSSNENVRRNWNDLSRIRVQNKTKYMILYGKYLNEIINDPLGGKEFIKNA